MFYSLLIFPLTYDKDTNQVFVDMLLFMLFLLVLLIKSCFFVCLVMVISLCARHYFRNPICRNNWRSSMMDVLLQRELLFSSYAS